MRQSVAFARRWSLKTLISLIILVVGILGCQAAVVLKPEPVTVALPALEQNALIFIAEDQGFFKTNGLDIIIRDYDSGVTSMQALLEKKADLAIAAEFPVVRSILKNQPVVILASIDQFENNSIIWRKNRGISKIADLKGKRIGVTLQTINEFHLGRFLELNGIGLDEVTLVDLKPDQFASAVTGGKVDALVAWQPYVSQIQNELKDLTIYPVQNSQLVYGLLVSRKDWLADHPDTALQLIKSIWMAEDYLARHPAEARAIVQKRLKYEEDYLRKVWAEHHFGLALDYSLLVAMTDEARWAIKHNLSAVGTVPNFIDSLYLDGLMAVKPEAVDIHR